jgi:hypothetical protein
VITITAYSNKNARWDLTINGTTPSALTLVDMQIEYDGADDPIQSPFYVPKFTFIFLGGKDLYEAFGTIGNTTHSFLLTGGNNKFTGYLTRDIFSMPNTGYAEQFSLNGISSVEALKFHPYEMDLQKTTLTYARTLVSDIITSHTAVDAVSFPNPSSITTFFPYINEEALCMNDDNNDPVTMLEVVEWILSVLCMRLVLRWDNKVDIYNLTDLFALGGTDYAAVTHAGIDEIFTTNEYYNSVTVECRESRVQLVNIDLKIPEDSDIALKDLNIRYRYFTGWFNSDHWSGFCRHMRKRGYFKLDQFDGWTFPHYDTNGSIGRWYDPDDIILPISGRDPKEKFPTMGAYPVLHKFNTNEWEKYILVNPRFYPARADAHSSYVWAEYNRSFVADEGDYICINGYLAYSLFSELADQWRDVSPNTGGWHMLTSQRPAVSATHWEWESCYIPVLDVRTGDLGYHDDWVRKDSYDWFEVSVSFAGKYWQPTSNSWVNMAVRFNIEAEENQGEQDSAFQVFTKIYKTVSPADQSKFSRYFSQVTGYWIPLPAQYGRLIIKCYFPSKKDGSLPTEIPIMWLKDFTVQKVSLLDDSQFVIRENPAYQFQREDTPVADKEIKKYTTYLSSYNSVMRETFISTMFADSAGTVHVSSAQFAYKNPQTQIWKIINERPEYHLGRISLNYISGMKKITDILNISDRQLTYIYKGDCLWENGCIINPLQDKVEVTYCYNRTNYDN